MGYVWIRENINFILSQDLAGLIQWKDKDVSKGIDAYQDIIEPSVHEAMEGKNCSVGN